MLSPLQAPDTLLMLLMTTAGPSGHITGARHQDDSFRMISALTPAGVVALGQEPCI